MSGEWPDKRREIAYIEARAVIEAQNATMTDIDEKAIRTVRLNAVLIGLLLTGLQFAPERFNTVAIQVTIGFFIFSTLCGIIAYNESNLSVGPQAEYIETLSLDRFTTPPWEQNLLNTMAGMIAENYDAITQNALRKYIVDGLLSCDFTECTYDSGTNLSVPLKL